MQNILLKYIAKFQSPRKVYLNNQNKSKNKTNTPIKRKLSKTYNTSPRSKVYDASPKSRVYNTSPNSNFESITTQPLTPFQLETKKNENFKQFPNSKNTNEQTKPKQKQIKLIPKQKSQNNLKIQIIKVNCHNQNKTKQKINQKQEQTQTQIQKHHPSYHSDNHHQNISQIFNPLNKSPNSLQSKINAHTINHHSSTISQNQQQTVFSVFQLAKKFGGTSKKIEKDGATFKANSISGKDDIRSVNPSPCDKNNKATICDQSHKSKEQKGKKIPSINFNIKEQQILENQYHQLIFKLDQLKYKVLNQFSHPNHSNNKNDHNNSPRTTKTTFNNSYTKKQCQNQA